jgi:hypothetical protein
MFSGSASLRLSKSLPVNVVSWHFEIRYLREGKKLPFPVTKENGFQRGIGFKNKRLQDADIARARALAEAELRRRLPVGGAALPVKAGNLRQTLNDFALSVLTAARRNPDFEPEYVPVGPGTAAGDIGTWNLYCAPRIGSWTFMDLRNTDDALARFNAVRDALSRPYSIAEREADVARYLADGKRVPHRLRPVGASLIRNTRSKICSCIKTVLREAARPENGKLVPLALMESFKYRGTRSTHARKVDLSLAGLNVQHTCWTYIKGYRRGELPDFANLSYFGLLWHIGARPGELLGLQWQDFNGLDDADTAPFSVSIKRTLETALKRQPRTLGHVKTNKQGENPDRLPIPLPRYLRPILRQWREWQRTRRDVAGIRGGWHVMTNETGTMNLTGKSCPLNAWWNRMRARIVKGRPDGCPVAAALIPAPGLYAFRHTAACYLLRRLRDPARVAAILGNSVQTLLNAYVLVMAEVRGSDMPDYVDHDAPEAKGGQASPDPASNVVTLSRVA